MKGYEHSKMVPTGTKHEGLGLRATQRKEDDAGEAQVDFSEIWETIRDGKWIILLTCALVTGGIAAYTFTQEPVYEASSMVSIEAQGPSASLVGTGNATPDLADEVGLLQYSADLSTRVAERLKETADAVESEEYFPILVDEEGSLLSDRRAGQLISEATTFSALSQQQMIRIAVRSGVPDEAAAIANAYAEEYQEFSKERSRASVAAGRKFLEEQAEKRREEIQALERQWAAFARQNDVMTQGEDGNRLIQEYTGLEGRRAELEFQLEQEERALEILQDQLAQYEPELRDQVMQEQEASEIQSAITSINQQIAQLRTQATQYYVANPDLRGDSTRIARDFPELADLQRRIAGFEQQKDQLVDELIAKASGGATPGEGGVLSRVQQLQNRITEQEITVSQLEAQIKALNQRLASYDTQLQGIPEQRLERRRLEQKLAQVEEFYGAIVNQLQQVIMQEESELGYVRPVRQAFVPSMPVSPNVQQNLILGILLGLGFGVGLAFLRRAVADHLRTPDDLQNKGYSLVGVIPSMDREVKAAFEGKDTVKVGKRKLSTRLFPLLNPWSPIAENYRLVRTNLQHSNKGAAPQVMLVTSPEKGDGKTLTAVNLAITMAQSGKRTILIDADLRRPNAHNMLDLPSGPGLAELLNAEETDAPHDLMPTHILHTEIDRLDVLPAGHTEAPPAEALDSERMAALLNRLRGAYDAVILDSPPVLAVSDPVLLATQTDATLLVVSAGRTDFEAIEVTEKTLGAVGVPIAGMIFNRYEDTRRRSYEYGYNYERTYGYVADER
jgi:capsular exopolysaccharide synthesis family protein